MRARPFLDIRSLVAYGGEQGLLGLAFSPQYARDHTFYVNYTTRPDGATKVVRYRARNGRALPGSAQQILRIDQPYANHNGGNVVFGPDGKLWVGMGDGGAGGDPENRAQNPKPAREAAPARLRQASPTPEICRDRPAQPVALQLRPQRRRSLDRRRRPGRGRGDRPPSARHHRPRQLRLGRVRGALELREQGARAGASSQPVTQYSHDDGCSVTGGYVYRGNAIPRLAAAMCSATTAAARSGASPRPAGRSASSRSACRELTSFGESLNGASALRGLAERHGLAGGGG